MGTCTEVLLGDILDVLRRGALTEEQARAICAQGEEAVVFALLELTKQLAEQRAKTAAESHQTPSTPSGMKPPYQKPTTKSRKRRPGAKQGHPGSRRQAPERIDWQVEHRADCCPDCGGKLKRCTETRRVPLTACQPVLLCGQLALSPRHSAGKPSTRGRTAPRRALDGRQSAARLTSPRRTGFESV